jgi:hypothetical protein
MLYTVRMVFLFLSSQPFTLSEKVYILDKFSDTMLAV